MASSDDAPTRYDVAIMGSGMSGAMLGAILARHGVRVAIVDSHRHPRFTIGEASIRETSMMIKILAERFDVPELLNLVSFVAVNNGIAKTSGMKRNISYAYHRPGEPQRPGEYYQVVIPEIFDGPEVHYFRQDVDQFMAGLAEQYGCILREGVKISDIAIDEHGVRVAIADGSTIEASYLVDGTGYKSVLAEKLGLRETPPRFRTTTRSIFTHMMGVKGYEDCSSSQSDPMMQRWSQGTLHHCFDGGWVWVIPFNNGLDSSNPLVSVGLQLDNRQYPYQGTDPETEFRETISRFPSIAEHFSDAKAARDWMSSFDRLQYSSSRIVGDRWCLMPHTAAFLDPLFSRGLATTMRVMLPLAEKLLGAVQDGDFSAQRFAMIEDLQHRTNHNVDVMVEAMYTSWRDFPLFDACVRFWYATGVLGFFHLEAAYSRFKRIHDRECLREMLFGSNIGSLCSALPQFQPYFADSIAALQAVDAGVLTPEGGAAELIRLIETADFLPPGFFFDDVDKRHGGPFDVDHWRRIQQWGNYESPREVKDNIYPGDSDENTRRFMGMIDVALVNDNLSAIRAFVTRTEMDRS